MLRLLQIRELLKNFTTRELMRWSRVEEIYGQELSGSYVFDPKTEEGRERLKELHKRVVEHVSIARYSYLVWVR